MDEKLVAACQMFLVPATILFGALGVATTEALKSLLCLIGAVVSAAWLYRLYRWPGLSDADYYTAFALAYIFFAAAIVASVVHFRLWHKEWKDRGLTGFVETLR
ncbi:hypothetical protein [Bradyrhizobium sp. USDA 329]|uniref:hypothetical protein n=1 Tax=unclassified Bradyrhizobium TaxID=2631580 RepID=UPI0035134B3D